MRRFAIAAAALAALAAPASALALPGVEGGVRGLYWFPDLSGNAVSSAAGVQGTRFDVKDDLGVEDESFPAGEAFLRFGRVHLRVGYAAVGFDGNRQITRSISFGGRTFAVDENVISRLDLTMIDGDVQVDLIRPGLVAAELNLGLIVKVKYVDGEIELRSASAQPEPEKFKAPVPMAGVAVGAGVLKNYLRADARVTGMGFSGNHVVEADLFASVVPFPFFRVQGGYRYIDLKVDEDDVVAEVTLKGPYVGAQLSF